MEEPKEFEEKVIQINRVSKKTKGGNRLAFSALAVVGNKKGKVGIGLGKAGDVASAIKKAINTAKKHLIEVPMKGTTVPCAIRTKLGAAKILIKPAPPGTGIIAGGPVRAVMSAAGINNVVAKILGSENKITNVQATIKALREMSKIVKTVKINMGKGE